MKGIVITAKYEVRVQEFSEPAYKSVEEALEFGVSYQDVWWVME